MPAPLRIVLLTFGDAEGPHLQAWMALLSLLAHGRVAAELLVVTDRPERYRWFGAAVRTLAVDAARFDAWQGPQRFFWRVKLEALRAAAAEPHADGRPHVLYLDSDVVCRTGLDSLVAAMERGDVFMHQEESRLGKARRRSHTSLRERIVGRTWAGVPATADSPMWNAGVVGVGALHHDLLDRALAVCDAILADGGVHNLAEQFAFSAALNASGRLYAAAPWVDHYWGNKPGWQAEICAQLAVILVRGWGVDEAVAYVREHPIQKPLSIRRRWWNKLFAPLAGVSP